MGVFDVYSLAPPVSAKALLAAYDRARRAELCRDAFYQDRHLSEMYSKIKGSSSKTLREELQRETDEWLSGV